jgi:hypothetical protein
MGGRNHFVILLLSLIYTGVFAQENADSTIRKNKIKQVYIYEGKRVAGTRMYDEDGRLTFEFSNNMYGTGFSTTKRGYEKGKLAWEKTKTSTVKDTTYTIFRYDEAGNLAQTENENEAKVLRAYDYDSLNRKVRALIFEGYEGVLYIEFKYDEHGRLVEETALDKGVIKESITRYFYDNENRLVKLDRSFGKSVSEETRYVYDKSGHVVQQTEYEISDGTENATRTFKYTYKENGLLSTWEDSDNPGKVFTYKYDAW